MIIPPHIFRQVKGQTFTPNTSFGHQVPFEITPEAFQAVDIDFAGSKAFPVIQGLIGIPAGIVRMNFRTYSLVTIVGSALWCSVLAWFGLHVLGDQPQLLEDPAQMISVLKARSLWFVGFVLALCLAYFAYLRMTAPAPTPPAE